MDNDKLVEPEIDREEFQDNQNIEINIDSINVDLLARAIYAEARG
jgi:spore germination cell wall hydrolase CwlJ-like protein